MSKEEYELLPDEILLREIRYRIDEPGRKQEAFIVATTRIEIEGETGVTRDGIAELYGYRWNIELDIRSIKTFMNLGHVRCKTPEISKHSCLAPIDLPHLLTCRGTKGQANAPEWQRCEAFQSMIPQVERELFSTQPCFGVLPLQGNNSIACSASARLGASHS